MKGFRIVIHLTHFFSSFPHLLKFKKTLELFIDCIFNKKNSIFSLCCLSVCWKEFCWNYQQMYLLSFSRPGSRGTICFNTVSILKGLSRLFKVTIHLHTQFLSIPYKSLPEQRTEEEEKLDEISELSTKIKTTISSSLLFN